MKNKGNYGTTVANLSINAEQDYAIASLRDLVIKDHLLIEKR